jgi:putative ABC transport system permease protein
MLARLAWRGIGRNKRRTIISIITIGFATMLSISMRGLQIGTYRANIRNAVELFSGYAQVQQPGYLDNPSLRRSYSLTPEVIAVLKQSPAVTGYAPRIYTEALAVHGGSSLGAAVFALDPEREKTVSKLHDRVRRGRFLASSSAREVVVGEKLLANLGVEPGDSIVVLSRAYDGTLGNMFFTIVGTVRTGMPDIDRQGVFMGLAAAQDLLSMGNRVNVVALALESVGAVPRTTAALGTALKPLGLVCLPWNRIMPEMEQSIQLDNVSGILMLAILVVVAVFGIMNTLVMSVTERFREFGILLAIGMPNTRLCAMVFIEFIMIMALGLAGGNLIATGVNSYIVHHPIEITGHLDALYQQFGFMPRMESTLSPGVFVKPTLAIFLVSLLAFIYPGLKVVRLEPMKGIRYT